MKDPKVISALCQNVSNIVNLHVGKYAENGIILTPSFALTETIAETLRKMKLPKLEIFEHHRGQKAEFLIDDFKKKSDKIKLLISPSIYEGVDLPGDLSRYQIIVKAPFPSLGEKRMKYILDNHPSIYSLITIQKLVQGAGRSVRSETENSSFQTFNGLLKRRTAFASNR
jgi:Rad3-related DNA helicase